MLPELPSEVPPPALPCEPGPPELPLEAPGSLLPLCPPREPELEGEPVLLPDDCPREDEDGIPPPDEPELEPLLEGMLDELPPERPELPELPPDGPEDPEEGEEDPGGELDGLPLEEDCCSGQPPIRKAVTALNAQSRTAATGKRR